DKRRIAVELYPRLGANPFSELLAPLRLFSRVERVSRRDHERGLARMRTERGPLLFRQMVQIVQDAGQERIVNRGKGQPAKQPLREVHGELDGPGKQLLGGSGALFAELRGRL